MADQVWPASLPQSPLLDGFQEKNPKNIVRTQMDQGPDKIRRRSTANVRLMTMRFVMDSTQVDTFDTFYNDTVKGGALKFDFTDPRTQTTGEFRIKGQPKYTPLSGGLYRVEVEMELMP